MKWKHICSLDWMETRQRMLTATDVKDLLPVTKTGRARKITDTDRIKVLARKLVHLNTDDCVSFDAAARGHIFEPYAIKAFNDLDPAVPLYHWDDAVVSSTSTPWHLAFSPDAMDVPQPCNYDKDSVMVHPGASIIGEVKSYSPEKHLLCGWTPLYELDERWQIATAMAALQSIKIARLIFFNPKMKAEKLFVRNLDRYDLDKEIEIVKAVEDQWISFMKTYTLSGNPCEIDEEKIIADIEASSKLNP